MPRIINALLLVSSLIGYLEWGGGNSAFLFEIEYNLVFGSARSVDNFSHPLVALPVIGQLLLLIAAFQSIPNKRLTTIGIALISALMFFILLSGVLAFNARMILSVVPFVACVIWYVRHRAQRRE